VWPMLSLCISAAFGRMIQVSTTFRGIGMTRGKI
jgi:hypothetical protein